MSAFPSQLVWLSSCSEKLESFASTKCWSTMEDTMMLLPVTYAVQKGIAFPERCPPAHRVMPYSLHPQAFSQLPQTDATWCLLCSQRSVVRGSRQSWPRPIAASRSWTLRVCLWARHTGVPAAARPPWAWSSLWRGEIDYNSSWLLENWPTPTLQRSCHLSAQCFFTPTRQNGSPLS